MAGAAGGVGQLLVAADAVPVRVTVLAEAERIVSNARRTKYQHKQLIDEATGTYYVDCSDYVSYALSRVAKRHLALIPKESWWPVPRAYKYYEFFAALPTDATHGWRKVDRLEDALPGDIIAWQLAGEIRKDHDTGHVWVVTQAPSPLGGDLIAVRACDSAAEPHYDDTRVQPDGTFQDGVGKGTFHLRVRADGKPTSFQFGPGALFHEDPIAIGRILPL
jgi:hypothetical protein